MSSALRATSSGRTKRSRGHLEHGVEQAAIEGPELPFDGVDQGEPASARHLGELCGGRGPARPSRVRAEPISDSDASHVEAIGLAEARHLSPELDGEEHG